MLMMSPSSDGEAVMNILPEKSLVLVKNFPLRALAESAQEILQEHGIETILQGSDIAGTGMAQGFDLYAQSRDAEHARELLESLYDGI
jgi:hypothetical protein